MTVVCRVDALAAFLSSSLLRQKLIRVSAFKLRDDAGAVTQHESRVITAMLPCICCPALQAQSYLTG
jgi:hypothetical protein